MKSVLNASQIHTLIQRAVDLAVKECAKQHAYSAEDWTDANGNLQSPTPAMLDFAKALPKQVKIKVEFQFDNGVYLTSQPAVDLSHIGKKKKLF